MSFQDLIYLGDTGYSGNGGYRGNKGLKVDVGYEFSRQMLVIAVTVVTVVTGGYIRFQERCWLHWLQW